MHCLFIVSALPMHCLCTAYALPLVWLTKSCDWRRRNSWIGALWEGESWHWRNLRPEIMGLEEVERRNRGIEEEKSLDWMGSRGEAIWVEGCDTSLKVETSNSIRGNVALILGQRISLIFSLRFWSGQSGWDTRGEIKQFLLLWTRKSQRREVEEIIVLFPRVYPSQTVLIKTYGKQSN